MTEKTAWDVERLKESNAELKNNLRELEEHIKEETKEKNTRLADLESFKVSTVEKLITIFRRLDGLKEDDLWIKRTFAGTLITSVIGAIISFVVWLIQN